MVNPGDALTQEGRVVNAKKVVTDGPFVESKEIVGGYSIVKADTIDAAAELAKGCPALLAGGKVEVRPLAGLEKPDTCRVGKCVPEADKPCPRHSRNQSLRSWSISFAARRGDWWPC